MDPAPYFKNTPLMKAEWFDSLSKTILSEFAPKWNTVIGDRITASDYTFVKNYEEELYAKRSFHTHHPNEFIINFIRSLRFYSAYFYDRLKDISLPKEFSKIPFMTREDLQFKITEILPTKDSLNRLIVNPTSGTTGTPILAPNHPKSIGCYVPFIEYSLNAHGVSTVHNFKTTTGIQLCYQNQTIVYGTCHSLAEGAKFAKINLKASEWKSTSDINNFINEQSPIFLSGDPYSFEEALRMKINFKPKAIHSTALELTPALRSALENFFKCSVINFYSLNETGPIAYSCPKNPEWMHILPHDIFIELIDTEGENSDFGEITITGGRNPYLPLLRYKTGDWGNLKFGACDCGEKSPKLKLLQGRKPISFTDTLGNKINPVDVSRILRMESNILRHQFIQKKKKHYQINLSIMVPFNTLHIQELKNKFYELLGFDAEILLNFDLPNDGTKLPVFINELETI
ncbi:MAG: phenylacetate--CoA ligase family protein [Leptospira sp.]|nr:phenylacetate--CoA ligase family protein [Leptospira sp.]